MTRRGGQWGVTAVTLLGTWGSCHPAGDRCCHPGGDRGRSGGDVVLCHPVGDVSPPHSPPTPRWGHWGCHPSGSALLVGLCHPMGGAGGCHSPGDRGVSPLGGGTAGRDSPRHPNGDTRWAQGSALRMRTTCPANRTRAHPQAARTAHCACALHRIGPGAHAHAQPRGAARMRVRSPRPSRRCAHAHSPPAPTGRTHARCRCPLRDNACAVRPRRPRP